MSTTQEHGLVATLCIACAWTGLLPWQLLLVLYVQNTDVSRRVSKLGSVGWELTIIEADLAIHIKTLLTCISRSLNVRIPICAALQASNTLVQCTLINQVTAFEDASALTCAV